MPTFKQLNAQKAALALSPKFQFSTVTADSISEDAGVYFIARPIISKYGEKHEQILYIGQSNNLRHHLYVEQFIGHTDTARLKKRLIADYDYPEIMTFEHAQKFLTDNCYFKYHLVETPRDRSFLEHGLKFSLSPMYLE